MALIGKRFKKEKKTARGTVKNALEGISYTFSTEINLRIHFLATVIVLLGCYILEVSLFELIICLLLIGLVISFELINTVIEVIVDMVEPRYNPLAKIAKDTASGAVLVMAITSAIIGIIIFLPKVLMFIGII